MALVYPDTLLLELLDRYPPARPIHYTAAAALAGDTIAEHTLRDLLEEEGLMDSPFKVGESYLICTVTLYYVGMVTEAGFGWLKLAEASWVHWTGRLSELLRRQDFRKVSSNRKPRVEPCGDLILSTSAIVSAYPWNGPLPKEPI